MTSKASNVFGELLLMLLKEDSMGRSRENLWCPRRTGSAEVLGEDSGPDHVNQLKMGAKNGELSPLLRGRKQLMLEEKSTVLENRPGYQRESKRHHILGRENGTNHTGKQKVSPTLCP